MQNLYLIISGLIILFSLQSCGPPIYGLAKTGSETTYMAKPFYEDTLTQSISRIYISSGLTHNISNRVYTNNEQMKYGNLMAHRSHTFKYLNLAYGGFLYLGSYTTQINPEMRGEYGFWGQGLNAEMNLNIPFRKANWRIIGVRMAQYSENGPYSEFRREGDRRNILINMNHNNQAAGFWMTSELVLKINKLTYGYYTAFGQTSGTTINGREHVVFSRTRCLSVSSEKFTAFAQFNRSANLGLSEENVNFMSLSLGLSYKLQEMKRAEIR